MDRTIPVAVVMPCYNYGRFISETIENVLSQTLTPAEIIVVDDGSTDNTAEASSKYHDVKYIHQRNSGPSSARNTGLSAVKSKYVIFPDADDILQPDALELLWTARQALDQSIPVVFGRSEVFCDDNSKQESSFLPDPDDVMPYAVEDRGEDLFVLSRKIVERMLRSSIVPQCSALIDREAYVEVGLWDERLRYIEDREMWIRIASRFRLGYLNRTVAKVRKHNENITNKRNWVRNHEAILMVLDRVRNGERYDDGFRVLASRQYASSAYILAQRYADLREYARAARMMWSSWAADTRNWKSLLQMVRYFGKGSGNVVE